MENFSQQNGSSVKVAFVEVFSSFWNHRHLIWKMGKREAVGRYRGSVLGVLWSLVVPILMLSVYTFVFGYIFQARWGEHTESKGGFAVFLFAGLTVYTLFADCVMKAPELMANNKNYVKKVVFPLETLPWVVMGSTLFHVGVSFIVLLIANWIVGVMYWTVLFLPIILFPLVMFTMGVLWFLAAAGAFIRDVNLTVNVLMTVLLFLSPIFYPASTLPEIVRPYLFLNPLTFIIEQTRGAVILGHTPEWAGLGIYTSVSLVVAWFGLFCFQRVRRSFPDVL